MIRTPCVYLDSASRFLQRRIGRRSLCEQVLSESETRRFPKQQYGSSYKLRRRRARTLTKKQTLRAVSPPVVAGMRIGKFQHDATKITSWNSQVESKTRPRK